MKYSAATPSRLRRDMGPASRWLEAEARLYGGARKIKALNRAREEVRALYVGVPSEFITNQRPNTAAVTEAGMNSVARRQLVSRQQYRINPVVT